MHLQRRKMDQTKFGDCKSIMISGAVLAALGSVKWQEFFLNQFQVMGLNPASLNQEKINQIEDEELLLKLSGHIFLPHVKISFSILNSKNALRYNL